MIYILVKILSKCILPCPHAPMPPSFHASMPLPIRCAHRDSASLRMLPRLPAIHNPSLPRRQFFCNLLLLSVFKAVQVVLGGLDFGVAQGLADISFVTCNKVGVNIFITLRRKINLSYLYLSIFFASCIRIINVFNNQTL